ncbi:IS3 family transposase [Paenibacillus dakarensis]
MDDVQRRIEKFIRFHNKGRAQRKLNKLIPAEYRNQLVG